MKKALFFIHLSACNCHLMITIKGWKHLSTHSNHNIIQLNNTNVPQSPLQISPNPYLPLLLNHLKHLSNPRQNHGSCDPTCPPCALSVVVLLKSPSPSKLPHASWEMRASRAPKKHKRPRQTGCRTLCCSCRLSISSSEEAESSGSDRFASISSLAHAMVQERLDQMIRERQLDVRHSSERRKDRAAAEINSHVAAAATTKFVVMVAMEKSSHDPRADFRDSMVEMITTNKIEDPKDLRCLLNYYLSMNSEDYRGMILEVFHEVCTTLFLHCKCRY